MNRFNAFVTVTISSLYLMGCAHSRPQVSLEDVVIDSTNRAVALDHFQSATLHEEAGELSEAAVDYQIAMLFDPKSTAIPAALAKCYAHLGERDAALMVLNQSVERNPNDPELLRMAGEVALRISDFEAAAKHFLKLSQVQKLERDEYGRLIQILLKAGRGNDALKIAQQYLEDYGPSADIYAVIARIHISLWEFDAADTALRKQLEFDPKNHRVFYVLGGFQLARSKLTEAELLFRQAVALDSTEPKYWESLLQVVSDQHHDDSLMVLVQQAIDLMPDKPQFYDIRGAGYQRLGDLDMAKLDAERSIAIDTARIPPYLALGFIHHMRKEWDESAEAYDKALALDAENSLVLNNYAYMLSEQGTRLSDALQMVEKALEQRPEQSSYLDTRGWIQFKLGDHEKALADITKASETDAKNPEVFGHLGTVLDAMNRRSDARKAFRKASDLEPSNPEYRRLAQ